MALFLLARNSQGLIMRPAKCFWISCSRKDIISDEVMKGEPERAPTLTTSRSRARTIDVHMHLEAQLPGFWNTAQLCHLLAILSYNMGCPDCRCN